MNDTPKDMINEVCDSLFWLSLYSDDAEYQRRYKSVNKFVKTVQLAIIADEVKRRISK